MNITAHDVTSVNGSIVVVDPLRILGADSKP